MCVCRLSRSKGARNGNHAKPDGFPDHVLVAVRGNDEFRSRILCKPDLLDRHDGTGADVHFAVKGVAEHPDVGCDLAVVSLSALVKGNLRKSDSTLGNGVNGAQERVTGDPPDDNDDFQPLYGVDNFFSGGIHNGISP